VLVLQGPRTVGKSVLLKELATTHGAGIIDLDDLAARDAVAADAGTFMAGPSPVCVDEYQHVPDLLATMKAELNRHLSPGRFILAGSTRSDAVPALADSLAGRFDLLTVLPFSQGEIEGVRENLLSVLIYGDPDSVVVESISSTSRQEYVRRVALGGFPIALLRDTDGARNRWFDGYVVSVLERDMRELAKIRQRAQLPNLLRRLASQTAQVLNISTTAEQAGLDRATATAYLRLLEALFLVRQLPAWGTTLRKRVAGTPKVHVIDSGLAARLLRISPAGMAGLDAPSLTEFGHLLETFVVGELLKQASWMDGLAGYGHWRTYDGDEVDLVIERDDGGIVAFEVKAGGRVAGDQMEALRTLRDAVGGAFIAGVALYTGARSYRFEDRLYVLPIDRLWTPIA
jgi:predicted AAA+ superfamily ATPase